MNENIIKAQHDIEFLLEDLRSIYNSANGAVDNPTLRSQAQQMLDNAEKIKTILQQLETA